jgi:hypothetical protein
MRVRLAAAGIAVLALAGCSQPDNRQPPQPAPFSCTPDPAIAPLCGQWQTSTPAPEPSTAEPSTAEPEPSTAPPASVPTPPTRLRAVHDPGRVTGVMARGCHTRAEGQLPDPRCTPGSYDPYMTAARICAPGYRTRSYRPPSYQTARAKYEVVEPAYGQRDVHGELDHLVPLELGGSNDLSNLWVEAGGVPNPKDAVENRLHDKVCSGQISLRVAQTRIAMDWRNA